MLFLIKISWLWTFRVETEMLTLNAYFIYSVLLRFVGSRWSNLFITLFFAGLFLQYLAQIKQFHPFVSTKLSSSVSLSSRIIQHFTSLNKFTVLLRPLQSTELKSVENVQDVMNWKSCIMHFQPRNMQHLQTGVLI